MAIRDHLDSATLAQLQALKEGKMLAQPKRLARKDRSTIVDILSGVYIASEKAFSPLERVSEAAGVALEDAEFLSKPAIDHLESIILNETLLREMFLSYCEMFGALYVRQEYANRWQMGLVS